MDNKLKEITLKVLKADGRLWDDEKKELNQTLLLDLVEKIDENIINLLLNKKELRDKFFIKIKDAYVFKTNDFRFFMEENKVDNSYTAYERRIGLSDGKRFISNNNLVVLDFPYKDCVLEGGQSTEEGIDSYFEYSNKIGKYEQKQAKRKEIFFNEILAKDEIDRLFDEKAFVNWKRHTVKGGEKVGEIKRDENGTIKENLIIKGNNLLALHSLKKQFASKVKLIYIDPPYNTGSDSFGYNDNFNHSTWLTFMKNRLEVAKELLKDDGIIFISLDDTESAYCKVLADEIFGRENYLATIAYQRSGAAGLGQGGKFVVNTAESILVYAKNKQKFTAYYIESGVPLEIKHMKRYNGILQNQGDKKLIFSFKSKSTGEDVKIYKHSQYKISTISLANFKKRGEEIMSEYKEKFNEIFRLNVPQVENKFQHTLINKMTDDGLYSVEYLVSRGKNKDKIITNYYYKKQLLAWLKSSAIIKNGEIMKTNKLTDFWAHSDIPKSDLANEGDVTLLRGKKPEQLLRRILDIATQENDIVLDYHLGSGTTCAVAHKMGRQYIGIEQLDYGDNDSVKRLQNVINGDQSGVSKAVNWHGGGDFIYFELAKWNETAKEKILETKSLDELEKLFDELYYKYFLNYNLKIKEFKEKVILEKEFKTLPLDEQKKMFLTMLDLNQMYVQKTEMADEKFGIKKEDQDLTLKFYGDD